VSKIATKLPDEIWEDICQRLKVTECNDRLRKSIAMIWGGYKADLESRSDARSSEVRKHLVACAKDAAALASTLGPIAVNSKSDAALVAGFRIRHKTRLDLNLLLRDVISMRDAAKELAEQPSKRGGPTRNISRTVLLSRLHRALSVHGVNITNAAFAEALCILMRSAGNTHLPALPSLEREVRKFRQ
jgi:hypothetical protein